MKFDGNQISLCDKVYVPGHPVELKKCSSIIDFYVNSNVEAIEV
jgi:hypothetical protein